LLRYCDMSLRYCEYEFEILLRYCDMSLKPV
jgi:hypothetical protein